MMGQYSFTKAERILKNTDFISVRKQGKRVTGKNFVIFLKANNLGIKRLGLAVSGKVGGAVKRNRIKRLLRELFRLHKEIFPPSTDTVISVKQGYNLNDSKAIEAEIRSMIS